MDVLLDTNAILATGLDGAAFGSLRDYLSTTKSRLLLSEIVVEELCAQQRSQIEGAVRKIASGNRELKRLIPDFSGKSPKVDVEDAVARYRSRLEQAAVRVTIIENSPADTKEMVRRLVYRLPPASPTGEEARDVLLWLTVLATGQKQEMAFVSGDKRAFFHEGSLKSELKEDLELSRSRITAYEGLDSFLKAHHHRRDSWVDQKWVAEQVETEQVDDALEQFLTGREERFVRPYIDNQASLTGYARLLQIVQREARDFFVSDITAESLLVGVTLWAEFELEVEYEYEHDWRIWRDEPTDKMKIVYPTVLAELELEVVGRKLKSVSVSDMERG
jgi:hypothetical protein